MKDYRDRTQLSRNFKRYEFECRCGCGFNTVDVELIKLCEEIRILNGNKPISPTSACRCAKHNKSINGNKNSRHMFGQACDFAVDDPKKIYLMLCERYKSKYGIGGYKYFIHVDVRKKRSRWNEYS